MPKKILLLCCFVLASPAFPQCYHALFGGQIFYEDGEQQTFNGLRCFFSGRLYWSRNAEVLKANYTNSTSIDLEQISKIEFEGAPTDVGFRKGMRKGSVTLRSGDKLKSVYLYVGECEWAKYARDNFTCADNATVSGPLTEPGIISLVISRTPKSSPPKKPK